MYPDQFFILTNIVYSQPSYISIMNSVVWYTERHFYSLVVVIQILEL